MGMQPGSRSEAYFPLLKSVSEGAADEGREMPDLRVADGSQREDLIRRPEVEVHGLRRLLHRALRRHDRPAQGVPGLAHVQGLSGRYARRRAHVQAEHVGVLGDLADARARRRAPPRPLRRRDLAGQGARRAHMLQRGARRLVVPRAIRDGARLVRAHGAHTGTRRRRHGRRQRLRQGRARGLAGDARTALRVPRLLAGQALHDDPPEAPGGRGAVRPGQGFDAPRDAAPGRPVGRALPGLGCGFWADFLEDVTVVDGARRYTHERLRKARSSLSSLVSAGTLFTYLDPELTKAGPLPATNNMIEGGVNSRLRDMLRNHRGLSLLRRVKAVFWWCHMHSGDTRTIPELLASMPTDADIDLLYRTYSSSPKREDGGPEWGDRAVWEELHHRDPFPFWLD